MSKQHQALSRPEQFKKELFYLDNPEKIEGKWASVISFDAAPLNVQSPRLKVVSASPDDPAAMPNDPVTLTVAVPEGDFRSLVQSIESEALKVIAEKSVEFFNRPSPFPIEDVRARHKSIVSEEGNVTLLLDPQVVVRNQYGAQRSTADLGPGVEISLFAQVNGVIYGRRSSELIMSALQVKVHMDPRPKDWMMEETVIVPDAADPEELSEEATDAISDAQVIKDEGLYFDLPE